MSQTPMYFSELVVNINYFFYLKLTFTLHQNIVF